MSMQSEREIDIHVGRQVKKRRQELGLSQSALARELGLTFQQVQKMKNGVNRIGAGRLHLIANILKCHRDDLYADTLRVDAAAHEVDLLQDDTLFIQRFLSLPNEMRARLRALVVEIANMRVAR